MTKVELEKISDPDMHIFIEGCMRGCISYNNKRFSKADNEYCPDYDENKTKAYIKYLDKNNLYGDGMGQYFPYGGFKWVKFNNAVVNRILNKSDNSLYGYFLEVDLDYPKELHDIHNDYSIAPGKIKPEDEMLSLYSFEIKNEYNIKTGGINKLPPNLMSKKNYGVHYRNLQYHLSQGLTFKKVQRIL